jgi:hypothetical protein
MDIVQLIEQLDQGCIRFVHFSKENELRSRVFSEKMGLESGWNCHVSLAAPEDVNASKENLSINQSYQQQQDSVSAARQEKDETLTCRNNRLLSLKRSSYPKPGKSLPPEETALLPRCSASVPEMVLLSLSSTSPGQKRNVTKDVESVENSDPTTVKQASFNESLSFAISSDEEEPSTVRVRFTTENSLNVEVEPKDNNQPSSNLGSMSSAMLSPDSFPEVYELVEQPTPLGIDLTNRVSTINS